MEKRFYTIEMRAAEDGSNKLVGYAAVFNQRSQLLYGQFYEEIKRGAFTASMGRDIRALWNHNADFPLGRTRNGTLSLAEDDYGLRVEITPPDTTWGRDAATSIQRGDVDQMSVGFDVPKGGDAWKELPDGKFLRTLTTINLSEVSPVVFPAYTGTEIALRSEQLGDMPEIPTNLRGDSPETDVAAAQGRMAARKRRLATHILSG